MSGMVLDVYRSISRVSPAILLIILFNLMNVASSGISDLRLCGDKKCQKVISVARALARHKQMDPIYLSFERGDDVQILSKSAGKNPDMWGGKVNERRGYFHKSFVQEYRVFIPNPVQIMPTEDHTPLEDKIMNFDRNQKPVDASSQNEDKVDNSGIQEKQEVPDSKKEGENMPDSDAVDSFDRDFEKMDDDTEISEDDENGDATDEQDSPKSSEQTKVDDKKSQQESAQEKQEVSDFEAKRKVNVLKHLNELDENLSPILGKKENEKAEIEELKKMLEARHEDSTSQDKTGSDQPTQTVSVHTQEDKDDTEIDEPEEDEKKSDAELLSQVDEKKENGKELDVKVEEDNDKKNIDVKKSDTESLSEVEEKKESKSEIDDTEIEEDVDDKKSNVEPLVHEDNGRSLEADDKTKLVFEKDAGHMKDIVQSQVEEAIKQTETEHKESVQEMQVADKVSDTPGMDTTKSVTKDQAMEAKNGKELPDLKKEEISDVSNAEAVSVNKEEGKLEQNLDGKSQDEQLDQGEESKEVPVVSKFPAEISKNINQDTTQPTGIQHKDHDHQGSAPERKDDGSLTQDQQTQPSGKDAKSHENIEEGKNIQNTETDAKDSENLADIGKPLQNGHQSISEQEIQEQKASEAGLESTDQSKLDQLEGRKDEVIDNSKSQEMVNQASENAAAGQQQTPDDSTGKPKAEQTEDKSSTQEQVRPDDSVKAKFQEGQTQKSLDSVEKSATEHLAKDDIERKTETVQLPQSSTEDQIQAEQQVQDGKEREPITDQLPPENNLKDLPSKPEQSPPPDSTEKKFQTEHQKSHQDITREKPADEQTTFVKDQVTAEAMRQNTPPVVENSLSPSEPTMSLQTVEPGFTLIDGTQIPIDMIEDTPNINKPSETPELKMSMTDKAITETTSLPDIQASKTQVEEQNTKEITTGKDDMQITQQQSQLVVSSRIQDVHSTIQESLSQHPSFTSSDADSLTSSETASLSETSALNTDATEETGDKKPLTEKFQQTVSVSEQLESSMGIVVSDEEKGGVMNEPSTQPDNDPKMQSEALTKNNTYVQQDETKPPPVLSVNQDIYATSADFISRKPLSHDGHFEKINKDPGNQEARQHQALPLENNVQSNVNFQPQEQNMQKDETTTKPTSFDQPESLTGQTPDKQDHPSMVSSTDQQERPVDGQVDTPQGVTPAYEPNMDIPPPPVDKPTAIVQPMGGGSSASDSANEPSTQKSSTERTPETVGDPSVDPITPRTDTYETDPVQGRKINDDDLEMKEDKIYQEENTWSKMLDTKLSNLIRKLPPSMQSLLEQEPLGLTPQMTVLVTIVTFMVFMTVSCCTLCCGSKKPKKKDPVLVVRALEEQLFIMTKEKENLEDDLLNTQSKMKEMEKSLVTQESSTGELETDLHNYKLHNEVLKTNIATLQQEINDLKKELTDSKKEGQSKHDKMSSIQKEVKQKDKKLTSTQEALDKSNKNLAESLAEITSLKSQIQSVTDQVKHLETRKQQLIQETDGWNEKVQDLTERLDQSLTGHKQMQEDLAFKENELEVLRDCFLQLKAFETDETDGQEADSSSIQEKFKSMMDVSRVNATLRAAEEEKDTIQNKLDIETQCRQDMEEQIACLQAKVETYQADKMKAERQSHEYQTKLNVLSHYFKEKELQLQRELGEHEALKKQNIDRLEHADERSKMVETELQTYKSQAEDLKEEILSAERDFRSQIAANEKKAHENWLAARAAERELKETKHESSVLRQKLTELERRLLHGPSGLIRPLPTRLGPPPGINGPPPPPPPGMDRPGSRGGAPSIRDDEFRDSPGPDRVPPPGSAHDRRLPPGPLGPGGPRMPLPPMMDGRSPPPYDRRPPPPPMDRRSPPPYERGLRMPPPPMDRRSPGYRMPPPDMIPRMRGPPPPHGLPNSPPPPPMGMGPPPVRQGLGTPRYRPPPDQEQRPRQQSQV